MAQPARKASVSDDAIFFHQNPDLIWQPSIAMKLPATHLLAVPRTWQTGLPVLSQQQTTHFALLKQILNDLGLHFLPCHKDRSTFLRSCREFLRKLLLLCLPSCLVYTGVQTECLWRLVYLLLPRQQTCQDQSQGTVPASFLLFLGQIEPDCYRHATGFRQG